MADTFIATALQDETLDALCWRVLGRTESVVEEALTLNPGLASQGPLLAEGQDVILPNVGETDTVSERALIQLWD